MSQSVSDLHPFPLKSHIQEADGIRGLACLLVLIVHATTFTFPATLPYLRGTGKLGVWLFFTLSAFLLTYQLLFKGFSVRTLVDYGIGRTLRIYPLFVLVVIGYFFLGSAGIDTGSDIVKALTFQKGYVHLWTIPVEFKFYFVLPFLVIIGRRIHSRFGWKGLLVTGVILTIGHQFYAPYWLVEENSIGTLQYLPAFLFGTIAAIIKVSQPESWLTKRASLVGGVILAGVLASAPFMRYLILGLPPSGYLSNKYIFVSLAWTVFIFSQTNSRGLLRPLLTSRALTGIGMWSYSIYLIHWLIMSQVAKRFPESFATEAGVLLLAIGSGYLMYIFLERPLFALRRRLLAIFDRVSQGGGGGCYSGLRA